MCKILPHRERNDLYKKKAIGWRGEALSSLCKSSSVRITTKNEEEPTGLRVIYSETGDIISLEPIELESPGTLIEVRDVHKNNKTYAWKFRENLKN